MVRVACQRKDLSALNQRIFRRARKPDSSNVNCRRCRRSRAASRNDQQFACQFALHNASASQPHSLDEPEKFLLDDSPRFARILFHSRRMREKSQGRAFSITRNGNELREAHEWSTACLLEAGRLHLLRRLSVCVSTSRVSRSQFLLWRLECSSSAHRARARVRQLLADYPSGRRRM